MKSLSLARTAVALTLVCLSFPIACGDSEKKAPTDPSDGGEASGGTDSGRAGAPSPGDAGAAAMLPPGISDTEQTIECGSDDACTSANVGLGTTRYYLDPCCTSDGDACGVSTAFLQDVGAAQEDVCQAKNQPGELDASCPSPPQATIPSMDVMLTLDAFPGCCRPSGVCGVAVDRITAGNGIINLGNLELGCVDAAPFFEGEDPVPCGEGGGGAPVGGASGGDAGGASGNDAGGAPGSGGVGGAGAGAD